MLDEVQDSVSLEQTNQMLDEALARKRARVKTWRAGYAVKNRVRIARVQLEYRLTPDGRAAHLVATARYRAKRRGLPFSISSAWVAERIAAGICEKTGLPFEMRFVGNGRTHPRAPSIDQKIAGLGYTEENSQVVIWLYNAAKQDADHSDVVEMATAIVAKEQQLELPMNYPPVQLSLPYVAPERAVILPPGPEQLTLPLEHTP